MFKKLVLISALMGSVNAYAISHTHNIPQNSAAEANAHSLSFQVVRNNLMLNKSDIQSVTLKKDKNIELIELSLTKEGADKLKNLTSKNLNQHMQVVWNGIILNSAIIKSPLSNKVNIVVNVDHRTKETIVKALKG